MTCHEFKNWLINKDILDEKGEELAKAHLDDCERCRKIYMIDSHVESRIKDSLKEVEIPHRLRSRIELDILSTTERKNFTQAHWKKILPAFAMAALLIIFINPFTTRFESIEEIGSDAVENHLEEGMTMAFKRGEGIDISRWFEGRLGFRVSPPDLESQGFQFLGGRKCALGKNDVAYLFYEKTGKKVSLFIINSEDLSFELKTERMYNITLRECDVKIWKATDQVYAMVE
jgi:hypothetical protein